MAKKKAQKEIVHIHYVHHIHHYSPAQVPGAPVTPGPHIMVHASMPGQMRTEIMTAPGYYSAAPDSDDA